ncbi:MAG: hypothetical protein QOG43_3266 [Actinomycetota bacterium]|nr:hypothetical protein [Actinomycetota bacterium]
MRRMPSSAGPGRVGVGVAGVLGALLLLGACSSGTSGRATTPSTPRGDDLVVQVASYDLAVGPAARFMVGVQSTDQRVLAFGSVGLRLAYLGTKDAPVPSPTQGPPVTATYLPIPGTEASPEGASAAQLVSGARARGVYGASVAFDRAGFWEAEVTADIGGESRSATGAFEVLDHHRVPAPGDEAPRSDNLTMDAPPDVPRAAIDSRAGSDGTQPIPDPELHATTVAAALAAGRPVVVAVSTPVYCISRFCGPVTDMVQELAHAYGDRATFVHIEVYNDFQADPPVFNRAAVDWIYRDQSGDLNEPWVFVVGGDGRVVARFDNVATKGELEPVLQALPVLPPPA